MQSQVKYSFSISDDFLKGLCGKIEASGKNLYSLAIGNSEELVFQNYFHSFNETSLFKLYSCTKSIVSLLVGIALEKYGMSYLDATIIDFFDEYDIQNVDERKQKITLHHLLNQTAGFKWLETGRPWGPNHSGYDMQQTDNWIEYLLNREMTSEPGTRFNYNTGVSNLLSVVIQKLSQMKTDSFADWVLFKPLGIEGFKWETDPQNNPQGGKGLMLSTTSLFKIGQLVLNGGIFNGERIVSESWLQKSFTPQSRGHVYYGTYGYHWWLKSLEEAPKHHSTEHNTWCAIGYGGQFLYMLPELDLIVVLNGNLIGPDFEYPQTIFKEILKAISLQKL